MEDNQLDIIKTLEEDSISAKKDPNISVFYFDRFLDQHVRRSSVFAIEYLDSAPVEEKQGPGIPDNDRESKKSLPIADHLMNDFVEANNDVQFVMEQTHCSYQNAVSALIKHKGDVVEAIFAVAS